MNCIRVGILFALALANAGCASLESLYVASSRSSTMAQYSSSSVPFSASPKLEYQNPFGGWQDVPSDWIDIPGTAGAIRLRLRLNGRTVSAEANYDGQPITIRPPCWCFTVQNNHDGGKHPLYVTVTYQDIGEEPRQFVATSPYLVMNNIGY